MKKFFVFLLIFAFGIGAGWAAKNFTLNDSVIDNMCVQVADDGGSATVTMVGKVFDDVGTYIETKNLVLGFDEMPVAIRANINNVMRLLSKEYSLFWVAEDVITWEDK
jgi:hypothetical protein